MKMVRPILIISFIALTIGAAFASQDQIKQVKPAPESDRTIDVKPLKLDIPRLKFHLAPIHVHIPNLRFKHDGKNVNIDPIHIDIPRIDIDMKDTHVRIPAIHFKVPKINVTPSSAKKTD